MIRWGGGEGRKVENYGDGEGGGGKEGEVGKRGGRAGKFQNRLTSIVI